MSIQSPLNWLGGKARIAKEIVSHLPPASTYKVFVDVFCGSCSVTFAKPRHNHLEVINDLNSQLVNFWMAVREDAEYLQWKLKTLPYSEVLFNQYRQSLNDEELDMIEQAARWYYVKRCTISGHIDASKGWDYTAPQSKILYSVPSAATSYQNAVEVLGLISQRLQGVQIHAWDFERIIKKYESPETLFYSDSPYHGTEDYYTVDETPAFKPEDHKRLARLLNETSAKVAISHYDCPELEEDYPVEKWRRVHIENTRKELSRMNKQLQHTRELLLCNYPETAQSLWSEDVAS